MSKSIEKYMPYLCDLIVRAGKSTLDYYQQNNLLITKKMDMSPLTQADLSANKIITDGLIARNAAIPVISEENKIIDFSKRKNWKRFWLIDPLDGTKEFIKGSDEFTVNIALIENNEPALGVVYAPAKKMLYFGSKNSGAYYQKDNHAAQKLITCNTTSTLKIGVSASHLDLKTDAFAQKIGIVFNKPVQKISCGSSLKICLLASGEIDVYPRFGPTSEWDTAAAHAILKCTGGELYKTEQCSPLIYNKCSLLNPSFIGVSCNFNLDSMQQLLVL